MTTVLAVGRRTCCVWPPISAQNIRVAVKQHFSHWTSPTCNNSAIQLGVEKPMPSATNREQHRTHTVGWLRAAVLGANDGIVSTASLIVGVATAQANHNGIMVAGIAGLVAGAMSMAAGEYVSVSSQADTEQADIERERKEHEVNPAFELAELAKIYIDRGLDEALAKQVAIALTANGALAAHTRDELGISDVLSAKPIQAAMASAAAFTVGAALPLTTALISPLRNVATIVGVISIGFLALLGALAAYVGGASMLKSILRVTFWGAAAMGLTALVGTLFGTAAT
jgi:vacuolar iron transporter family protein